jgi:hypothetical protein
MLVSYASKKHNLSAIKINFVLGLGSGTNDEVKMLSTKFCPPHDKRAVETLRVQFGSGSSFIVWNCLQWVQRDIPIQLSQILGTTIASNKKSHLRTVSWNELGTFLAVFQDTESLNCTSIAHNIGQSGIAHLAYQYLADGELPVFEEVLAVSPTFMFIIEQPLSLSAWSHPPLRCRR